MITTLPSERSLGITSYKPIDYDPETIPLALMDEVPEELRDLKAQLRKFIKNNSKHWSASTLSQFLGIDVLTLKELMGSDWKNFNTERAHTVLVLKPIADAEADNFKFQSHLL